MIGFCLYNFCSRHLDLEWISDFQIGWSIMWVEFLIVFSAGLAIIRCIRDWFHWGIFFSNSDFEINLKMPKPIDHYIIEMVWVMFIYLLNSFVELIKRCVLLVASTLVTKHRLSLHQKYETNISTHCQSIILIMKLIALVFLYGVEAVVKSTREVFKLVLMRAFKLFSMFYAKRKQASKNTNLKCICECLESCEKRWVK